MNGYCKLFEAGVSTPDNCEFCHYHTSYDIRTNKLECNYFKKEE